VYLLELQYRSISIRYHCLWQCARAVLCIKAPLVWLLTRCCDLVSHAVGPNERPGEGQGGGGGGGVASTVV